MATADWQKVKVVLADALEEPPENRPAFIKRSCNGDTTLMREVEALLAQETSVLESVAVGRSTRSPPETEQLGRRVGAYEIVREIGRGGMGAVYLAKRADGVFEKEVAIKLLKRGTDTDEVLRRFREERRILARLEHPNIARMLDAGEADDGLPYFVMEYVAGVPITTYAEANHLSVEDRLKLFLLVCDAVEFAHEHLVVHRDLKPTNILVTREGQPKLLDFGIAKVLDSSQPIALTMTIERRLTPVCASPEQARGEQVTPASDVYALGALLYELLTAKSPHQFSTSQPTSEEITRVICEQEPAKPSSIVSEPSLRRRLRGDLDTMAMTALRKEPALRYTSVGELAEDVRRHTNGLAIRARRRTAAYLTTRFISRHKQSIGASCLAAIVVLVFVLFYGPHRTGSQAASGPPSKSIAVLPFENVGEDKSNAFFADGMQDEILSDLAKAGDLKVVSRTSVMQYRGSARKPHEIGEALQVAYLLEGAVQKVGSRIHMSAQLINTRTEARVWNESYDRDTADVFVMQRELAEKIVAQLKVNLSPREKVAMAERTTDNVEAYDWYLRAKEWAGQYRLDKEGELEAEGFLDKAIQRDPKFARAYCLLSTVELILYRWFEHSPERKTRAEEAMKTALRLRPDLGEVRLTEADYYYRTRDFDKARMALGAAGQLLPNNSDVLTWSSAIDQRQGRWKDSLAALERAVAIDPRNPEIVHDLIRAYRDLRRYSDAERLVESGLATYPQEKLAFLDDKFAVAYALGDTRTCREIIESLPRGYNPGGHTSMIRFQVAFRDRDWEEAERIIDAAKKLAPEGFITPIPFLYGFMARAQGNPEKARPLFAESHKILEQTMIKRPDDAEPLLWLALTDAALGRKEEAIREGREAVAKEPISRDASTGAEFQTFLAQIYAWAGQKDLAIEQLTAVVKLPNGPTVGSLKQSADWDDLRGDARFASIIEEAARPIDPIPNGEPEAATALNAPTKDLVAYDLFLRGEALMNDLPRSTDWEGDNRRALDLFERAVTHDPMFALAYAQLSEATVNLYIWVDHSEALLAHATEAAQKAAQLAPTSPDTYVAQGRLADALGDCARAFERFGLAHQVRPDDATILSGVAEAEECNGMWDDALRDMEKAKQLAPDNSTMPNCLKWFYHYRRDYRASDRICDEAIARFANGPSYFRGMKVANSLARGDWQQARARLAEVPEKFDASGAKSLASLEISYSERDCDRFKREYAKLPWDHYIEDFKLEAELMRALVAEQQGDRATVESVLRPRREKVARDTHDASHTTLGPVARRGAQLARLDSYLGQIQQALRESEDAVATTSDPEGKPRQELIRAEVLMRAGQSDAALDILERIARVPYGPSYGELLGSRWDRLREQPRFHQVIEELRLRLDRA